MRLENYISSKEGYESPSVTVMDILSEGVLCESGFTGSVTIDDFILETGDDSFIEF